MRTVTATEKYRAVNEGRMAKAEFVRQMRQQFPQFVSQYNGYEDTVQILKNRQMIFEAPVVINEAFENMSVYADRPALTYSLDVLERGIAFELNAAGIEVHDKFNIKAEDLNNATSKAKANLDKDPNHYINLLSGESSKVDKHDREEEVKRGEGKIDTFNGLKKANLKEAKELLDEVTGTPRYPEGKLSVKDKIKAIVPLWKQWSSASGRDADAIKDKISRYTAYDNESGGGSYVFDILDNAQSIRDVARIVMKNEKGDTTSQQQYSVELLVPRVYFNVESGELSDNKNEWYTDAELKAGADQTSYTKGTDLDDVVFSGDYEQALDFAKRYPNLIKVVKKSLNESLLKEGKLDDLAAKLGVDVDKLKKAADKIRDMEREKAQQDAKKLAEVEKVMTSDVVEEAPEMSIEEKKLAIGAVIDIIQKKYPNVSQGIALDFIKTHYEDLINGADPIAEFEEYVSVNTDYVDEAEVEEKKGTDHDGDGDIDSDDYMMAKDKAIKKAMGKDEQLKEAIKSIIKKTLNDQALNEAATMGLAALSDQYDGLKGFKTAVIDLQNIVTEIESFNDRIKEKIQSVFTKTGDIQNEDGLKVGAFLAPTIMNAFKKDLGPVMKGGHIKNIDLPKTSIFKPQEPAVQEEPKQTVFGLNEDKK